MKIKQAIENCTHLTPIEQNISSYILNHPQEILELSIDGFSNRIYVSKSAVLRFCKKIGLNGYNDLKVQLAKDYQSYVESEKIPNVNYPFSKTDSSKNIANKMIQLYDMSIKDTYQTIDFEQFDRIAEILNSATIIDIYTHAHNLNVADNFKDKMLTIGRHVNTINDFYSQRLYASASNSQHVALILSYSKKASWIESIIEKLKETKTTIILIGKSGNQIYENSVKYSLSISNLENIQDRYSQFSSHIALQYCMDILYSAIYQLNFDENVQYNQKTIDYLDDRKK